jgi:hypothetical protein
MAIDVELVAHLEEAGYHPRTSRHSDFQSLLIVRDLVAQCPAIARKAASGEIVAKLRHHQQVGHADWVIDIAIGTAAGPVQPPTPSDGGFPILLAPPVIIQIAIELKSVWTEHGKARLNRLRDFHSFHGYAHQYSQNTVAAGFLVVNSAERFWSPLRPADDITMHGAARKPARQLAKETVDRFRSIHLRDNAADGAGMEAVGVVVVEHDNLLINPHRQAYADLHKPTRIAPVPPSPAIGDPLHYETMIQRICNAYTQRFG